MHQNTKKIQPHNQRRLEIIGQMLKEIRFSEGRNQDEYIDFGVTRRKIQSGEYGSNMTLNSLFVLLDCFSYSLDDFFQGMD